MVGALYMRATKGSTVTRLYTRSDLLTESQILSVRLTLKVVRMATLHSGELAAVLCPLARQWYQTRKSMRAGLVKIVESFPDSLRTLHTHIPLCLGTRATQLPIDQLVGECNSRKV